MAKKVTAIVKLQVPAGKATPAPPIGPAARAGVPPGPRPWRPHRAERVWRRYGAGMGREHA